MFTRGLRGTLLAAALLAAVLPAGAGARQKTQSIHFAASVRNHVLELRLLGVDQTRPVTLRLAGHTLTSNFRAPYRVSLGSLRVAASGGSSLVARDAGSGRTLAALQITAGRRTPVVAITTASPATTSSTSARVAFSVNLAGTVTCALDGGTAKRCASPVSFSGLKAAAHSLTISDRFGLRVGSATVAWTVLAPPPPPRTTTTTTATTTTTTATTKEDDRTHDDRACPDATARRPRRRHPPRRRRRRTSRRRRRPRRTRSRVARSPCHRRRSCSSRSRPRRPTDIVLADGTYDNPAPFSDANDHRVYAAHLGGAVLTTGIVLGGNFGSGGAILRGLAFDVSSPAKTFEGGIVQTWGNSGTNASILDTTFDGNAAVDAGILGRQVEGLVVRRVIVQNLRAYGILVDENVQNATVATPPILEDISVAHVSEPTARPSNGTAEACIWLGVTGTLRRAKVRDCAWDGFWSGTSFSNGTVSDLDVDQTPVGLYLEHYSTGSTYQRLLVGSNVSTGVNCEWADPAWNSKPGCNGDTIADSVFHSSRVGVYLDQGTTNVTVRGCTFIGQSWAGIGNYQGVGNSFANNDFSGLGSGAVGVSTGHV